MGAFERMTSNQQTEQGERDQSKQDSLAQYEKDLINDQDEHPWWPFLDGGVRDENGALWSVFNRWYDETQESGWKVVYCPEDEVEFREIPVTKVVRQEVYSSKPDKEGLTTFQLHIAEKALGFSNNDILNVLQYRSDDNIRTTLRLWNHTSAMVPTERQAMAAPQEPESAYSQDVPSMATSMD